MAIRKRTISPMIWEDPSFNQLSIQTRFIFIGMISNSNDEGYVRADSGSIKRLLFGFDDTTKDEIGIWLNELREFKNMHLYSVGGEDYAHFLNWDKYQKQQQDRIQPNEYPKCVICLAPATHLLTEVKRSKVKRSKCIVSKDTRSKAPKVPNEDINELIAFFKKALDLNLLDGSEKMNRRFAWLALKKFKSKETIKQIIQVASQNDFWKNKITDFKGLYYQGVKIASSVRDKKKQSWNVI